MFGAIGGNCVFWNEIAEGEKPPSEEDAEWKVYWRRWIWYGVVHRNSLNSKTASLIDNTLNKTIDQFTKRRARLIPTGDNSCKANQKIFKFQSTKLLRLASNQRCCCSLQTSYYHFAITNTTDFVWFGAYCTMRS